MWIIYKHTNLINNKSYIGQTSQNINDRWHNGNGYQDSPKFWNAIQKYGWNNFKHEIIEENIDTIEKADEREAFWISFYDTVNNGYNINEGGGHHTRGAEFARKVSEGQKQNWNNNLERKEKARERLLKQWKDENYRKKFLGSNNGNSKQIKCIETNQIFNTLKEAAAWANTSRQNITGVLKGRQKTAANYHWEYYEGERNE